MALEESARVNNAEHLQIHLATEKERSQHVLGGPRMHESMYGRLRVGGEKKLKAGGS